MVGKPLPEYISDGPHVVEDPDDTGAGIMLQLGPTLQLLLGTLGRFGNLNLQNYAITARNSHEYTQSFAVKYLIQKDQWSLFVDEYFIVCLDWILVLI